jgi:hypothetical protein
MNKGRKEGSKVWMDHGWMDGWMDDPQRVIYGLMDEDKTIRYRYQSIDRFEMMKFHIKSSFFLFYLYIYHVDWNM